MALVCVLNGWFTAGGLFLTVAGAAGVGVFWERWSRLTGYEVELRALAHPVAPTSGEVALVATHGVMLLAGVALLLWHEWGRSRREGV